MAITASQLLDVSAEADLVMLDKRINTQYNPNIETLRAIKGEQTATIAPIEGRGAFAKSRTIKVWWQDSCAVTARDTTDNCTLTGAVRPSTDSVNYTMPAGIETLPFAISDADLRDNELEFNKTLAKLMLRGEKVLFEKYVARIIAAFEANKECPTAAFLPPTWSCTPGKDVVISGPEFSDLNTLNLMEYVGKMNDFADPYLLSGFNLWNEYKTAMQNAGNGEGKGENERASLMRSYFDPRNIDVINTPNKKTYMIDKGIIALFEANFLGETPGVPIQYGFGQKRWHQESKLMPGVFIDVVYEDACVTGGVDHVFKMQLNPGIFFNPAGCNTTNKGLVSFVNEGI